MIKLTAAQLRVLKLAESDTVLLIAKRGTNGSIDTRNVRRDVVMRLYSAGLLTINISHGDDMADGFTLTHAGHKCLAP